MSQEVKLPIEHKEFSELVKLYKAVDKAAGAELAGRMAGESIHMMMMPVLHAEARKIIKAVRAM